METPSAIATSGNDSQRPTVLRGKGIDASDAGHRLRVEDWPGITSCEQFDPATERLISIANNRPAEGYDFVYSCRLLQSVAFPAEALYRCWSLVKPRGYLTLIVPDEDLYEQGTWPSRFNSAHQWTFTIAKPQGESHSWSPRSINLIQLIEENLRGFRPMMIRVRDAGYDYDILGLDQTLPPNNAEAYIECFLQKLESVVR